MERGRRGARLVGLSVLAAVAATPAVAHETPAERANKQVVLDFYRALNDADASGTTRQRIGAIANRYISPDYVQHAAAFADAPGPGSARDKLIRLFRSMPPMKPLPAPRTIAAMAEGDRVMLLTARDMPDPGTGRMTPAYIFNMFRVKDHRLVVSCPLLSGPSTMTVWIEEGTTNACEEAQARGDHRQAA